MPLVVHEMERTPLAIDDIAGELAVAAAVKLDVTEAVGEAVVAAVRLAVGDVVELSVRGGDTVPVPVCV